MTREQWKYVDGAMRRVCRLMRPAMEKAELDLMIYGVAVVQLLDGSSTVIQAPSPYSHLPPYESILQQALKNQKK